MQWITRERPRIDRIACPWLVDRLMDDDPDFLYRDDHETLMHGMVIYDALYA